MSDINPLVTSASPPLEGASLNELEVMRQQLLFGKASFDEMTEAEVERYIAICAATRLAGRQAAKPAGAGGSTETKKRAARTPAAPPRSLADIMKGFGVGPKAEGT